MKRKFVGEEIHVANKGVTFHTTALVLVGVKGTKGNSCIVMATIIMDSLAYLLHDSIVQKQRALSYRATKLTCFFAGTPKESQTQLSSEKGWDNA